MKDGQVVEEHFAYLEALVGDESSSPSSLGTAIQALSELRDLMQQMVNQPFDDQKAVRLGQERIARQLQSVANGIPEPLRGWLVGVAASTDSLSSDAVRRQLNAVWQTDILPLCKTLRPRFPFSRSSDIDVSVEDLRRLLGPGGVFDRYFQEQLQPFVDTSRPTWQWRNDLGIDSSVPAYFQRAKQIGASIFGDGSRTSVEFTLEAFNLSRDAKHVSISIDGQSMLYDHGPPIRQLMTWPGLIKAVL